MLTLADKIAALWVLFVFSFALILLVYMTIGMLRDEYTRKPFLIVMAIFAAIAMTGWSLGRFL